MDEGALATYSYAVTKSIMRVDEALATGTRSQQTKAVFALRRLIGYLIRDDEERKERLARVDAFCRDMAYLRQIWPRAKLPSWQGVVQEELVDVARGGYLLDIPIPKPKFKPEEIMISAR